MNKQFATEVAKQLERRGRRRRLAFLTIVLALVAAAASYLRCGNGWGIGGWSLGAQGPERHISSVAKPRCMIRVSARGITVDDKPKTRDEAVAACKETDGAIVTITGDARQGTWDELKAALDAANIKIYTRGP